MIERRYQSTESLDGVIDLERLRSGPVDSLERSAQRFFELTYLSEDLHKVLKGLSRRFKEGTGAGTVLAQAVKGLGKSHTLLLGYHLFKSLSEAKAWTAKAGYDWTPPENPEVIVHKFTDQSMPGDALWMLIGQRLKTTWSGERAPDLDDFRTAIKDCHLVLILDELERGIEIIPDLIELVFERITESGGFQGTRSALGLLGAMLDATPEGSFLMSGGKA